MEARSGQFSAARLTPAGRGAVATIRVCVHRSVTSETQSNLGLSRTTKTSDGTSIADFSRVNSLFRAANGLPLCDQPLGRIAFGQWGDTNPEELVICRLESCVIEIHCHGGEAAVQRVLNDLQNAGCVVMDWREQEALGASRFRAECLDVLARTSTWRTTQIVLEQTSGLLKAAFERLGKLESKQVLQSAIDDLLVWADFGLHLSKPWSVVLTGRPNVGKSSLINALLGYQRAIVFDQPGTTRDVVTGETAFNGWPVTLADTAGIRDSAGTLEAAGISLARERLQAGDLTILVIDTSTKPAAEDQRLLEEWPNSLIVANKSDLGNCWSGDLPADSIAVSCVTGEGLKVLEARLVRRLVPNVPAAGVPIPLTVRQVELLKEIRDAPLASVRAASLERLLGTGQN